MQNSQKHPKLQDLNEQNYLDKTPRLRLLKILIPVIVFDLFFIFFAGFVTSYNIHIPALNDNTRTSLTFDGKSVYTDGSGLTFVVDNNEKSQFKILNVYGMAGNITPKNINVSNIADDTHTINKNSKPAISNVENSNGNPKEVTVSIPTLQPGSYQGYIFLIGKNNNSIPIPMTVATEPKVYLALLWVVVGILTSIIFWEIINYVARVKKLESEYPDTDDSNNRWIHQTAKNAEQGFSAANTRRILLHRYVEHKLISKNFFKVTTIDIATIGFGIAVGFLALLNQAYITAIRSIEPIDIVALVGLGLGIGSLREFVNKASDTTPPSAPDKNHINRFSKSSSASRIKKYTSNGQLVTRE